MKSQPPKHRKVVAKSLDFSGQICYRENFPPKFLAMKCSDFTLDSGFVTFSNLIFFCLFRVQVYTLSRPSTTEWSNASKMQEPNQAVQYRAFTFTASYMGKEYWLTAKNQRQGC